MPETIIVTQRDDLEDAIARTVRAAMLEAVPDALREATAPAWMNRSEVCKRYGLTPRQLTYMRKKGRIEYSQHGRRILYSRESLEAWIDAGRVRTRRAGG